MRLLVQRIRPKKRLGQNFLTDQSVLEREAEYAQVSGADVLEIGAGDGRLTEKLLEAGAKSVLAVEKDRELAGMLRKKFADAPAVKVEQADFLEMAPGKFDVIAGNIPYYISSPIIFRLLDFDFRRAVLCVQKEFGERIVAKPGMHSYGRLSAMSSLYFNSKILEAVPADAFEPRPRVSSALVLLEKTGKSCTEFERDFINAVFQHRKKKLSNAIFDSRSAFGWGKEDARKASESIKYRERRVFTLALEELLESAAEIMKKK